MHNTSEEKRNQMEKFMNDVSKLDKQSFDQLQFAASILLARERQVRLSEEKEVALPG